MTKEEIEELKGLAASMGLYDDKNPCKRAVILGKAIKALEQEPCDHYTEGYFKGYDDGQKGKLEQEPCEDMSEVSDGYHTFNQLYHQRAVLFATIVNQNKDKSWKSWKHSDGKYCFDSDGEWFIVGIDTPQGSYTYHYAKEYWDMFHCKELRCAKHWDGHTEKDVTRLFTLEQEPCEDCISREAVLALPRNVERTIGGKIVSQSIDLDKVLSLPRVKQEPKTDGDCISRVDAIENIKHAQVNFSVESDIDFTKHKREVQEIVDGILNAQIKVLSELPSVQPKAEQEPKTGHWIPYIPYDGAVPTHFDCSKCGAPVFYISKYCPECGSKNTLK